MCSPFLKWAGGKRQLIPIIEKMYPFDDSYTRYVEPFIGGGAVLFDILSNHNVKEIYISDINEKLVNTYIIIQKHCNLLINELTRLANEYTSQSVENKKKYFLARRENFNDVRDVLSKSKKVRIEQAALMIFLNKTCFNGLYRVNSEGKFNVSFGEYKNPMSCMVSIGVFKTLFAYASLYCTAQSRSFLSPVSLYAQRAIPTKKLCVQLKI